MPYASIEARRAYNRAYHHAHPDRQRNRKSPRKLKPPPPPPLPDHLDPAPLLALVDEVVKLSDMGLRETLAIYGLNDREVFRMKARNAVSVYVADKWACRLGVPSGDLWPELRELGVAS